MEGEQDIADVLERAADLIEPEGAWTQRVFARNAEGRETGLSEHRGPAVCWCIMGATAFVSRDKDDPFGDLGDDADMFLAKLVGGDVGRWNDAPERTQAEVVAKLREAAALARAHTSKDK